MNMEEEFDGVFIPQEAIAGSNAKKKERRTLRQLPIYRDMSNLKSMIVDLYDILPRKMTKYADTTLGTACEAKKCIGLAEASRDSEERSDYLKTARVFVEDIIDDATILFHKKRIDKKKEKQIKDQARKVVAQCVAWRDYTNDQGAE